MSFKPHISTQRATVRVLKGAALGAAAVLCLSAGAGAAQAQVAAPGAAHPAHLPHLAGVRMVNLHQRYAADLKHVKLGKIAGIVRPRGWHGAQAAKVKLRAACTEPNCNLVYNGGPVQHNPRVFLLFWGPNWNTDPNQLATSNYMAGLYEGLGVGPQDTWSPITSQYGDGSGFPQFTGSELQFPIIDDTSTPPTGVTQAQLAAEADAGASVWDNNGFPITNNSQIVVATQSGTCPQGFACGGSGSYCAWHSYSNEPFINMPYQLDAGGSCGENFINPGTAGIHDGFSMVGGHEYAETITDPVPGEGWMDLGDGISGGEIGDKCAWGGILWGSNDPAGDVNLSTGSFAMQSLWSNAANGCVMAASEDTVSVTSPGNRDTGTGGTVDLQLSGSSSGSNPLQWTATGLPAGLSISATGFISGTATTAGTYNTTVYASDDTGATGSAAVTWTVAADSVTVNSPGNQTSYANAAVHLQLTGASSAGFNPLFFSSADLPADLFVNGAGLVTGHVPHPSTYPVTITATDAGGISGSASFNWTIKPDVGKAVKETSAGVCLNDNSSITTVGNPVTVAHCNGSGAQKWTFPTSGTGKLTVFGMCLGDPGSGGTGTKLALATCSSATSDNWTHNASGEYVLKLNGLCLTDPGNSAKAGTKVTITKCTAATSQVWTLP